MSDYQARYQCASTSSPVMTGLFKPRLPISWGISPLSLAASAGKSGNGCWTGTKGLGPPASPDYHAFGTWRRNDTRCLAAGAPENAHPTSGVKSAGCPEAPLTHIPGAGPFNSDIRWMVWIVRELSTLLLSTPLTRRNHHISSSRDELFVSTLLYLLESGAPTPVLPEPLLVATAILP